MPIYDYRCDHCGHAFSAVQSFADAAIDRCPSCGRQPRRLLVPPAIVFKGSGWYKTDSRKAPTEEGAKTGTATTPAAETAPSAPQAPKAEAPKPAPKAAP